MAPKLLLCVAAGLLLGAAGASSPIDRMAGRYDSHRQSGDTFGYRYFVDDALEIVPLDRRRAYFRARLNFANHHSCAIWGVAHVEARELVYRTIRYPVAGSRNCEMRIRVAGNGLDLVDVHQSCAPAHCGVRGSFNHRNPEFQLRSRRPIRYLGRLRRSPEYAEALREDDVSRGRHR